MLSGCTGDEESWTDHCMVRVKLRMMLPWSGEVQDKPLPFAVHKLANKEMRDNYVRCLEQKLVDWSSTNEAVLRNVGIIYGLVSYPLLNNA